MFLKAPPRNFPGAIFPQAGRTPWLKSEGFRSPSYRRTAAAFALTLLSLVSALPAQAHNIFKMSPKKRAAYFAKINEESYQNWQRMIDLLHIKLPKNLPPPAQDPNRPKGTFQKEGSGGWTDSSGNTYTRSVWGTWNNYDEAKANPYLNLPNPLILEFGLVLPPGFHFPGMPEPSRTGSAGCRTYRTYFGSGKGPSWSEGSRPRSGQEQVLDRGWGRAVYDPTSVQADNGAGLSEGIIGLMNKGKLRTPDQWGAIRAWAWGASQILNYFETDKAIDAKKVGLEGLSRYGKAVLVTMAYDQRFAIVLVGSSGKGGAALFRRDYGEDMGNICSSGEYHWFAGNLLKYVLHPDKLSVDSNELFALCAPRPVFVSCGSALVEGRWVDDRGQFMAEAAASPVYKLLGEKGLGTDTMPPMDTPLMTGALAFRQHHGPHTVAPNWPYFLKFAERYFDAKEPSR